MTPALLASKAARSLLAFAAQSQGDMQLEPRLAPLNVESPVLLLSSFVFDVSLSCSRLLKPGERARPAGVRIVFEHSPVYYIAERLLKLEFDELMSILVEPSRCWEFLEDLRYRYSSAILKSSVASVPRLAAYLALSRLGLTSLSAIATVGVECDEYAWRPSLEAIQAISLYTVHAGRVCGVENWRVIASAVAMASFRASRGEAARLIGWLAGGCKGTRPRLDEGLTRRFCLGGRRPRRR